MTEDDAPSEMNDFLTRMASRNEDESRRFAEYMRDTKRRHRPRARRDYVDDARARFQVEVLRRAEMALVSGDQAEFQRLRNSVSDGVGFDRSSDEPGAHERYLDQWRVFLTAGLVAALFAIVFLVLLLKSVSSSATPYISLLSGLAGIALGWMFANSSNSGRRDSRSSTFSDR